MRKKKKIQQLTIKDNFLFGAVMCDENNCRRFLEMVFGFPIARVEVSKEKSLIYHPEYKGVRLDIYAQNDDVHYNIEMQAVEPADISKRTRYYHSQIDLDKLSQGVDYVDLPKSYVIFVCDFDPFGKERYLYTFRNICVEDGVTELNDESISIFLSTKGKNDGDIPDAMVKFLKYVGSDLQDSEKDFDDDFVKSLQESVASIKASREMESKYMTLQEMLKDEHRAGVAEGRAEGLTEGRAEIVEQTKDEILNALSGFCEVPDSIRKIIKSETEHSVLMNWYKAAVTSKTLEEFEVNFK